MLLLLIALTLPLLAVVTGLALRRSGPVARLLCPACDGDVARDFNACPRCGTALRRSCPGCGEAVRVLWRACPHCGRRLGDGGR